MLCAAEVPIGGYVVGYGILFYVADRWTGETPSFMLAHASEDKFMWVKQRDFELNFDKVEKHALGS